MNNPVWQVLPLQFTQLQHFLDLQNAAGGQLDMNEPVKMAATLLIVGPPLLLKYVSAAVFL